MSNRDYLEIVDAWIRIEERIIALNRMHAKLVRKRESAKWAVLADYVWKMILGLQDTQDTLLNELLNRWDFHEPGQPH